MPKPAIDRLVLAKIKYVVKKNCVFNVIKAEETLTIKDVFPSLYADEK